MDEKPYIELKSKQEKFDFFKRKDFRRPLNQET